MIAPPNPNALKGFTGGLSVIERGKAQVRAHAMIVVYDKDTRTSMHMHPDAESLFVVLDGAIKFIVNGKDEVVKPGQAAFFGIKDRHGLRADDGLNAASFLEFHIPAGYTTVRG